MLAFGTLIVLVLPAQLISEFLVFLFQLGNLRSKKSMIRPLTN